jgi:hypothetical protein
MRPSLKNSGEWNKLERSAVIADNTAIKQRVGGRLSGLEVNRTASPLDAEQIVRKNRSREIPRKRRNASAEQTQKRLLGGQ